MLDEELSIFLVEMWEQLSRAVFLLGGDHGNRSVGEGD